MVRYTVGKTRSEKVVFCVVKLEDIKALFNEMSRVFATEDLFDAFALFDYLSVRAVKKGEDSEIYEGIAQLIVTCIPVSDFLRFKNALGIRDVFGIRDHGRLLANVEFFNY